MIITIKKTLTFRFDGSGWEIKLSLRADAITDHPYILNGDFTLSGIGAKELANQLATVYKTLSALNAFMVIYFKLGGDETLDYYTARFIPKLADNIINMS